MRRLLCHAIAYSYDAAKDAFIINGRACRITLHDVEHITGLPCMGKKHVPSNHNDTMELWMELKDSNDIKVTLKGLLAKMKGDNAPNFVRPFVFYAIGKYICPTTQQYVDNRYLGIVTNVETIKNTNLGQLTLEHLIFSIKKFVNG
ncbi:hypothetical protein ZWY2020_042107 [Hordeum vulgare]|nr:hypothetical protein ZWY2020_042107 [Hordeum vulgare]